MVKDIKEKKEEVKEEVKEEEQQPGPQLTVQDLALLRHKEVHGVPVS